MDIFVDLVLPKNKRGNVTRLKRYAVVAPIVER